jgi:hypothetical protein
MSLSNSNLCRYVANLLPSTPQTRVLLSVGLTHC